MTTIVQQEHAYNYVLYILYTCVQHSYKLLYSLQKQVATDDSCIAIGRNFTSEQMTCIYKSDSCHCVYVCVCMLHEHVHMFLNER